MEKFKDFMLSSHLWLSVIVLAAAFILSERLRKYAKKRCKKAMGVSGKRVTNIQIISNIVKYVIWVFAIVTVLQINGVNVSSLVTGLGVAGVIVGFALQDILKDLIMGSSIVMDEFYSVGDVVKYKDIEGKVVYFNIKVTKIRDVNNGNLITISNRNISEIELVSDWRDILVPVSYDSDNKAVKKAFDEICAAALKNEYVKDCYLTGLDEFCDSSVNYRLRVHSDPFEKAQAKRAVNVIIRDVFENNGITIPFPQSDVHIKN